MHILIVGGAGFIGSNTARHYLNLGHQVTVFDNLFLGRAGNVPAGANFVQGDAQNKTDFAKLGSVDIVLHFAGASSSPMFQEDLTGSVANNILGHINVMEFAKEAGAQMLLFASTSSVYGNNPIPLHEAQSLTPPNYYAVTKHTQEELSYLFAKENNLPIVAFRFMSVFGPNEEHKGRFANVVTQFMWGMHAGVAPVIYGDGTQTRDFTHVENLLHAFDLAIAKRTDLPGLNVFNVGTAEAWTLNRLIEELNKAMGKNMSPVYIPNPIKNFISSQQADLTRIQTVLGYQPKVSFSEGLSKLVDYHQREGKWYPHRSF